MASPVTVQPSTKDARIIKGTPDTNYGSEVIIVCNRAASDVNGNQRPVISFTIPSIPESGAVITSIKMYLYKYYDVSGWNCPAAEAHESSRADWVESEVTWNSYKSGFAWTTAGGDFSATIISLTTSPLSQGSYGWEEWILQGTGATNPLSKNWGDSIDLFLKYPTWTSGLDGIAGWYTKDYTTDPTLCPKLIITYSVPSPPTVTTGIVKHYFATDGVGWVQSARNSPPGINYNGYTYIAWQGAKSTADGDPYITRFNNLTGEYDTPVKVGTNNSPSGWMIGTPVVIVRTDPGHEGKIMVIWGGCCLGGSYLPLQWKESTNPEDITSWGSLNSMGTDAQWYNLIQVNSGDIYLFYYSLTDFGSRKRGFRIMAAGTSYFGSPHTMIDLTTPETEIHSGSPYYDKTSDKIWFPCVGALVSAANYLYTWLIGFKPYDGKVYDIQGNSFSLPVTYSQLNSGSYKFAAFIATGTEQTLDEPSVDFDSSLYPHLIYAYTPDNVTWYMRYTKWNGSSWVTPTELTAIASTPGEIFWISPTNIDIYGREYGSPYNASKWNYNGSSWNKTTILSPVVDFTNFVKIANSSPCLRVTFCECDWAGRINQKVFAVGITPYYAGTKLFLNGNITATGGTNATRRGFCYKVGTSGDPTTGDSVVYEDGDFGISAYVLTVTGLTAETDYRIRAYAINDGGTGYGTTIQIKTEVSSKLAYDETGKLVAVRVAQGISANMIFPETGRTQAIIAAHGKNQYNIMNENSKLQVILAAIGEWDGRIWTETGLSQTIKAVAGRTDNMIFNEIAKLQILLNRAGHTGLMTYYEGAKTQTVVAIIGQSDYRMFYETGLLQEITAVVGEAEFYKLQETGKEQIILVLSGKTENLIRAIQLVRMTLEVQSKTRLDLSVGSKVRMTLELKGGGEYGS